MPERSTNIYAHAAHPGSTSSHLATYSSFQYCDWTGTMGSYGYHMLSTVRRVRTRWSSWCCALLLSVMPPVGPRLVMVTGVGLHAVNGCYKFHSCFRFALRYVIMDGKWRGNRCLFSISLCDVRNDTEVKFKLKDYQALLTATAAKATALVHIDCARPRQHHSRHRLRHRLFHYKDGKLGSVPAEDWLDRGRKRKRPTARTPVPGCNG